MRKQATVTLSRTDYEALLARAEDAEDLAAIAAAEARERALGIGKARHGHLPAERVKELVAGEHPIRVWRRHRGLTREALAARADVSGSYLSEIETGRKRGSFAAIARLAAALDAPLDTIAAWIAKG